MVARLQAALHAPVFADRDKTRSARIVHRLIVAMLLMVVIAIPAVLATGLPPAANRRFVAMIAVALVTLLVLNVLLRRGHVRLAGLGVLVQLGLAMFFAMTSITAGVTLISLIALILLVPLSGMLFGTRGVWAALAFVLLTLTFVLLRGALRPAIPLSVSYNAFSWLVLVAVLVLFGFAESLNAQALSQRLDDATRLAQELAARNGELEAVRQGLAMQISERTAELVEANTALQASEARYRSLFENAAESIVVMRASERRLVDANPAAARLFGYSLEELVGKTVPELSAPIQPDGLSPILNRGVLERVARGDQIITEWTIQNAAGGLVDVQLYFIALPSDDDDLVRVTIIDISSRKAFEAKLKEREATAREFQERLKSLHAVNNALSQVYSLEMLFQRVVELGRDELGFERLALFLVDNEYRQAFGTFGIDTRGRLRDERDYQAPLPPAVSLLLAEQPQESAVWQDVPLLDYDWPVGQGWNMMALLRHQTRPTGYLVADNLITGAPLRPFQPELLALYGVAVAHHFERVRLGEELQHRAADLQAANQALEAYQAGLEAQVHERTRALAEAMAVAESANRAKTNFLATMSHELRTPLHAVIGFLQLLRSETPLTETQARYASIMEQSALHLTSLVDDALNWSRLETVPQVVDVRRFNPVELLHEIAEVSRPPAARKGLELVVECGPLPDVAADERKLRQVLTNLVGNSVRYTADGRVTLRCSLSGEAGGHALLACSVADTGIGLTPEAQQRVFEPFVRIDPDDTVQEGSGLGLAIVRQLVEVMGGDVMVKSEPGVGSEFFVRVPVATVDGPDESIAQENAAELSFATAALAGKRVLVVEDMAVNRLLLNDMLAPAGPVLQEARTGKEALEALSASLPDLLLIDVRLPDMSGLDVIAQLRAMEGGEQVPVIVLSAHVARADEGEALAARGNAFLRKPFRRDELFAAIAGQLPAG